MTARIRQRLGGEPWLLAVVVLTAICDALASVLRYLHFESGIDLAIFDQAVWHYSRLEAPFSSIKGEDLLGDHFHPIVALLAPLYWIWSDPRTLLIAQALLVAASVVPVFLFARDKLGRAGAYLLAIAYAAFWGLQVGVLFDFHEVAFAPLLIACAILFADRRNWPWFWVSIVLLLGVKEDTSALVAMFGIYLLTLREFRRGAVLIVAGVAWYELATHVFIPHFSSTSSYAYFSYSQLGHSVVSALWTIVHEPWKLVTVGLRPAVKAHTLILLFAPFLFLSLCSRLVLLTIPLLAERFLSTNSSYWGTHFHYSMPIAPVLAMAAAGGARNLSRWVPERHRARAFVAVAAAMLIASVAITRIHSSDSALTWMTSSSAYTAPAGAGAADRALAAVPAGASVATTDQVLSHLTEREIADPIDYASVRQDSYLVVNVLHIGCCAANNTDGAASQIVDAALPQLTPVFYDDGWLVARGPASGIPGGDGVLPRMAPAAAHGVIDASFAWRNALLSAVADVGACNRTLAAGQAAGGCLAAIETRFATSQSRLRSAIDTALPTLTGGCVQIGQATLADTAAIAAQIAAITRAGSSATLVRDYLRFVAAEQVQDRTGVIARFVILCTPSGSSP